MIVFDCPNCGNSISVEDDHAGRSAWCRKCRRISTVPRADQIARATAPSPASVPIHAPIGGLGEMLHAPGPGVPVQAPISGLAGPPIEWNLRAPSTPIDLKHIQPAAREEVRKEVTQAATEVDRLTQQRSDAIKLLQESASEISRLIGELAAAREENEALRKSLSESGGVVPAVNAPANTGDSGNIVAQQLQTAIAAKDDEIARLTQDWATAREEIAALHSRLARQSAEHPQANDLQQAMARDFDAALTALAEREIDVVRLDAELHDARERLRAAEDRAGSEASGCADESIAERDQRIADLEAQESAARHEAEELRAMLREREAEYQSAYYELNALRHNAEERSRIAHDYAEISQTLVDSRTRLKEQEARRSAVEHDLQLAQQLLAEREAQLQKLRYEIVARESSAAAEGDDESGSPLTEVERAELLQQIEALKAQNSAATERAWALHHALEKASASLREREAQVEVLGAQLQDLQSGDSSRAEEISALAARLDEVTQLSAAASDETAARDAIIEALRAEQDEARAALEDALTQLAQRDDQLAVLQVESGQWQARLDERVGEVQQLTFERDLAAQQRQDAATEAETERANLRNVLGDLQRAHAELEEARTYIVQRDQLMNAAQTELAQWRARDEEHAAEIRRLKERLDDASRQVEAAAFESEAERSKWQPLLASHEEMKAALDDARMQLSSRDEQIRGLLEEAAERSGIVAARESELTAERDSLLQARAALEGLTGQIETLRGAVAQYEASLHSKDSELATFKQALEDANAAVKEREDRCDDLDFQVAGLSSTMRERDEQLANALQENEALLQQRDEQARLLAEAAEARERSESGARASLESIQRELTGAQDAIVELQGRLGNADGELQQLRETVARLNAREADLRSALDHRTVEVERLLVDISEFRAREQQQAAELESRDRIMAEMRAALDAKSAELESLCGGRDTAQSLAQERAAQCEALATELAAMRERIAVKEEEADGIHRECELLRGRTAELESAVGQLQEDLSAERDTVARVSAESAQLRDNAELYRQSSDDFEREASALRAELALQKSERDALEITANEARKTATRFDIELAALRAEFEREVTDKGRLESIAQGSQEAASRFQAELDALRAEIAQQELEKQSLADAAEQARLAFATLEAELALAREESSRLMEANEGLRLDAAHAAQNRDSLSGELDTLRAEVLRLQRQADAYADEREQESRRLTQQLEQAVAEVSRSAQEIERLSSELDLARARADGGNGGAPTLEEAFKLQHTFAAANEDLWKHAPSGGASSSITPEVLGDDEQDEQKMLVDALLRFLGRR